jgi:hypothetical protein
MLEILVGRRSAEKGWQALARVKERDGGTDEGGGRDAIQLLTIGREHRGGADLLLDRSICGMTIARMVTGRSWRWQH